MKNKQSSIEWLVEMTSKLGYVSADIAEQAKEMHKSEIMAAYDMGNQNQYDKINFEYYLNVDEEQYYNDTFGGNNEQQ